MKTTAQWLDEADDPAATALQMCDGLDKALYRKTSPRGLPRLPATRDLLDTCHELEAAVVARNLPDAVVDAVRAVSARVRQRLVEILTERKEA